MASKNIENELNEITKKLEESRELESYYQTIGESGERYEEAKCTRIKYEKLYLYFSLLEDLPSIHEKRYASNAQLDSIRDAELNSLRAEEYSYEVNIQTEKDLIKQLQNDEKNNLKEKNQSKKVLRGKSINADIYEAKERQLEYELKLFNVRKRMKYIESLGYEELREDLIGLINDSSNTIKLEQMVLDKGKDFYYFESVAGIFEETPKKVMELANGIMEVDQYKKDTRPRFPEFSRERVAALNIPEAMMDDLFNNSNVYSYVNENICDPELANKKADEFLTSYFKEKEIFDTVLYRILKHGGHPFKDMLEYSSIQEEKEKGDLPLDKQLREKNLIEFFSLDHSELISDLIYYLPEEDEEKFERDYHNTIALINSLSYDLKHFSKPIFYRRRIKRIKNRIYGLQIEMYKHLWDKVCSIYNEFNSIKLSEDLTSIVNNYSLEYLKSEKDKIDETYKNVSDLSDELREIYMSYDRALRDYEESVEEKAKKVKEEGSYACCKDDILFVKLKGDRLIHYIYENAAISRAYGAVVISQKDTKNNAFDEEARLSYKSPAELHYMKMEEHEKKITEEYEQKILALKKSKKQENSSENN